MQQRLKKHRKNVNFSWQDFSSRDLYSKDPSSQDSSLQKRASGSSVVSEAQYQAYSQQGAFVLENAFTAAEVAAVIAVLDPLEAQAEAMLRELPPKVGIARADEITFSAHLVAQSQVLADFSRHPTLQALCIALLGLDVRLYWDQLVYKKPDTAAEFPWHQDNGYTFLEPQQYLTCWIALSDATPENGCPWVVPGLHREGTLAHRWTDLGFQCFEDHPQAQVLPVAAGSIAVFSSLTPHRTGPNLTGDTRKSYILQYAPDGALMYPNGQAPLLANNPDWQFPILEGGVAVV
jgi:phytanoyl-CoA hydroxylase